MHVKPVRDHMDNSPKLMSVFLANELSTCAFCALTLQECGYCPFQKVKRMRAAPIWGLAPRIIEQECGF